MGIKIGGSHQQAVSKGEIKYFPPPIVIFFFFLFFQLRRSYLLACLSSRSLYLFLLLFVQYWFWLLVLELSSFLLLESDLTNLINGLDFGCSQLKLLHKWLGSQTIVLICKINSSLKLFIIIWAPAIFSIIFICVSNRLLYVATIDYWNKL